MEETAKESNTARFRVLMFPWLGHSHVSSFLELSKRLVKSHFKIYFCSTGIILNSIKASKSFDGILSDHSLELVQLDFPDFPELPPHYHTTKNLPSHLKPTLKNAFHMSKTSFCNILNTLKPDLLIYDVFQPWASELAALNHIPSVLFLISGSLSISFHYHAKNCAASGISEPYPFPAIFFKDYELKKMMAQFQEHKMSESQRVDPSKCIELSSDIVLVKTSRQIEGKYIDHLCCSCGKTVASVGPLTVQEVDTEEKQQNNFHIIQFLNNKKESSVIYISFGSECFLSKEEREEIAYGLELSNANFIWVVRFPMGHAVALEAALPEGFLERVEERGIVVDGWAPQAKILQHASTGGFVSHCGWGSVMESIYYGVPLLALPMHLDQPVNARLAVEIGVGIEIMRDQDGQIKREEVAKAINMVVADSRKVGVLLREKAKEMSNKLREEGEEELNEALETLRKLCSRHE